MGEVPCERPCSAKLVCRRVTRAGVTYRCARALAEALGINVQSIYQSLHKHGDAEHCGIRKGIRPGSGKANHRKPVKLGADEWPSISAMARDLGIDRSVLGKKLKTNPSALLPDLMKWKARHERAAFKEHNPHL